MNSSEIFLTPSESEKLVSEVKVQQLEEARKKADKNSESTLEYAEINEDRELRRFNERSSSPMRMLGTEGIPDENGPPVSLVKNGKAVEPTDSEWRKRILLFGSSIEKNISSVGRIKAFDKQAGTCFVISSNLVMTNHHVGIKFWNTDDSVDPERQVFVDFAEGTESDSNVKFRVLRAVKKDPNLDFAILEVELNGTVSLPPPLKLRDRPLPFDRNVDLGSKAPPVYIIGYPSEGSGKPKDKDLEDKFFPGIYGVKRFAPGLLSQIESRRIGIDSDTNLRCSYNSLKGNSGSPVFDFETGDVIGLHYDGQHGELNYAVPIWRIRP